MVSEAPLALATETIWIHFTRETFVCHLGKPLSHPETGTKNVRPGEVGFRVIDVTERGEGPPQPQGAPAPLQEISSFLSFEGRCSNAGHFRPDFQLQGQRVQDMNQEVEKRKKEALLCNTRPITRQIPGAGATADLQPAGVLMRGRRAGGEEKTALASFVLMDYNIRGGKFSLHPITLCRKLEASEDTMALEMHFRVYLYWLFLVSAARDQVSECLSLLVWLRDPQLGPGSPAGVLSDRGAGGKAPVSPQKPGGELSHPPASHVSEKDSKASPLWVLGALSFCAERSRCQERSMGPSTI